LVFLFGGARQSDHTGLVFDAEEQVIQDRRPINNVGLIHDAGCGR
jgi:hypothetical protein